MSSHEGDSKLPFGLSQEDIDCAARELARLGYDVGDQPPVEAVGVSPNLRMATYLALKAAENSRAFRETRRDGNVTES